MEIYLDANATTPVLPQARAAALSAMADAYGNPSSVHSSGLKARALLDEVRAVARRVLGVAGGRVLFTSGATEGIQTAVLSALTALQQRRAAGQAIPGTLLYGATEHKAVPEALKHWNLLLGLDLQIQAIPVGIDGRHDLAWLRAHVADAGLVCTMAANNETGVISDLDGIAAVLAGSPALWLVDSVQALGKLPLHLATRPIDYAPFSGHKLYAPKGIGLLYVREGAPFTPLLAGGGQEGALRSGTENMAGIAGLGAVLQALEAGDVFGTPALLDSHRARLVSALREAFPGVVFNAAFVHSLPTTLNFSVPGIDSQMLLDLFDAAGLRMSGGSACGAARAQPSYVLEAMGLPEWQTGSAVRLSFGAAEVAPAIDEACLRLRACGESLRATCQGELPSLSPSPHPNPVPLVTRFTVDAACCYLLADPGSRRCVVIDPLPELTVRLAQWIRCRAYTLVAVLDTHSQGDHASSAQGLRDELHDLLPAAGTPDALGWPGEAARIELGGYRLQRLALPGHTGDSMAYLLHDEQRLLHAFVGDAVMADAPGHSDFVQSAPPAFGPSLKLLAQAVGMHTLLLPGHDDDDRFATTLNVECAAQPLPERAAEAVGLSAAELGAWLDGGREVMLVDVREAFEAFLGLEGLAAAESVPLSSLANALPRWLALPAGVSLVFVCRSGNRSAKVARALRRLGRAEAWSLAGGLALWPSQAGAAATTA